MSRFLPVQRQYTVPPPRPRSGRRRFFFVLIVLSAAVACYVYKDKLHALVDQEAKAKQWHGLWKYEGNDKFALLEFRPGLVPSGRFYGARDAQHDVSCSLKDIELGDESGARFATLDKDARYLFTFRMVDGDTAELSVIEDEAYARDRYLRSIFTVGKDQTIHDQKARDHWLQLSKSNAPKIVGLFRRVSPIVSNAQWDRWTTPQRGQPPTFSPE